jgi:hypothetical protein
MVPHLVAQPAQIFGQLVVIDVLGEPPGPQQFIVLQRLPTAFDRIERRVETMQ